jgi:GTPase involved in cell partitioning and DNA repair
MCATTGSGDDDSHEVLVEIDGEMNSLLPFHKFIHYRTGHNSHGMDHQQDGAKGEDFMVKVPPRTVVWSLDAGVEMLEMMRPRGRTSW